MTRSAVRVHLTCCLLVFAFACDSAPQAPSALAPADQFTPMPDGARVDAFAGDVRDASEAEAGPRADPDTLDAGLALDAAPDASAVDAGRDGVPDRTPSLGLSTSRVFMPLDTLSLVALRAEPIG
ncbi:MAG: hypothetical protein KC620_12380, partial [Myxococcales bacterium]|nr:hypothetical protein [Myxococcales bacterium]